MSLNERDLQEAINITREAKPLVDEKLTAVWPFLNCITWFKWLFGCDEMSGELKVSLVSKEDEE
jgi:hypothetical protein